MELPWLYLPFYSSALNLPAPILEDTVILDGNAFGILAVKWRIYTRVDLLSSIVMEMVIYGETQKVNGLIQFHSMPWGK